MKCSKGNSFKGPGSVKFSKGNRTPLGLFAVGGREPDGRDLLRDLGADFVSTSGPGPSTMGVYAPCDVCTSLGGGGSFVTQDMLAPLRALAIDRAVDAVALLWEDAMLWCAMRVGRWKAGGGEPDVRGDARLPSEPFDWWPRIGGGGTCGADGDVKSSECADPKVAVPKGSVVNREGFEGLPFRRDPPIDFILLAMDTFGCAAWAICPVCGGGNAGLEGPEMDVMVDRIDRGFSIAEPGVCIGTGLYDGLVLPGVEPDRPLGFPKLRDDGALLVPGRMTSLTSASRSSRLSLDVSRVMMDISNCLSTVMPPDDSFFSITLIRFPDPTTTPVMPVILPVSRCRDDIPVALILVFMVGRPLVFLEEPNRLVKFD